MVTEEQLNLKNIKKSAWLTFTEFLHEVNHTLMNDFVSMPNDEINRYMKMEKLLENKISRRFKVRRLEIHDFGYLMEHLYGRDGIAYEDYEYQLPKKKLQKETLMKYYDLIRPTISGYLTKELLDLNVDTIRTDIPTSSTVTEVIVWSIKQSGTDTFSATYEVDQQIKDGEQTSNVKATYTVKVHVDADGDMVIVQNPTLAPVIEKSYYEPKTPEADASVDADTVKDATAFLETFFKLYPTATEKELAYYVSGNVLEPIGKDYLYSELVNPVFTRDGDNVKVKVAVKFLDNQTKATQVSQYELVLHKDSNWKIVENAR